MRRNKLSRSLSAWLVVYEKSTLLRYIGESPIVTIAVSITDKGDYVETMTATLAAANTTTITIGTLNHLVGAGGTVIYYFYWNTTKIKPAWYGMSVTITSLAGETFGNVADNSFNNTNQIHVLPLGDINQDVSVTITDLSTLICGYGSNSTCNCRRWNLTRT